MKKVFKNHKYMTPEQLSIADDFQNMIEAEYALCVSEMKKANKLAMSRDTFTNDDEKLEVDCACSEIDAIRKYWYNRLNCIVEIIEWRNPRLAEELARKYLSNE